MNWPNRITIFRLLIPVAFLPALMTPLPYGRVVALALFLLGVFTDWLDGYLARRHNIHTEFGRLMDPLADKILIASALISFVALMPEVVRVWMVVVIISRDFLITGLRQLALQRKAVMSTDVLAKHKTALQMIGISTVLLYLAYLDLDHCFPEQWTEQVNMFAPELLHVMFYAIVLVTFASGLFYLWKYRVLFTTDVQ